MFKRRGDSYMEVGVRSAARLSRIKDLTRYSPRKGVCWTITGKHYQAPVAESLRLPPATQGGK